MYSEQYFKRQEMFLSRLTGETRVFLVAKELGPCIPISDNTSVCVRLFRPWSLHPDIRWTTEGFRIDASLAEIVALGCANEVLAALRKMPKWKQDSLMWPHSALLHLANADDKTAREKLDQSPARAIYGTTDWQAAGVYWAVYFEDRKSARTCFEKACSRKCPLPADPALLATYLRYLCGDEDAALLTLAAEWENRSAYDHGDVQDWQRWGYIAEAWVTLFDRPDLAATCLSYLPDSFCFSTALAWSCILGNDEEASAWSSRGMVQKHEEILPAALYACCIACDTALLHKVLWNPDWSHYQSINFRMNLARTFMLCSEHVQSRQAEKHAKALIYEVQMQPESDVSDLCRAATLWSQIAGEGAESILRKAEERADESCHWCKIAETWMGFAHLSDLERLAAARKSLEYAEELADDALDDYIIATSYKSIIGDDACVIRCIQKGGTRDGDMSDIAYVARAWVELLDLPKKAKWLITDHTSKQPRGDS
jgi:hypothetical protein